MVKEGERGREEHREWGRKRDGRQKVREEE